MYRMEISAQAHYFVGAGFHKHKLIENTVY